MFTLISLFFVALIVFLMTRYKVIPFGMNVQVQDPNKPTDQSPAGVAGLHVDPGAGARVPATPIVLDPDAVSRFISEAVTRAVASVKETLTPAPAPAVAPEQERTPDITAEDVVKPWQRRVVKYFNSFGLESKGKVEQAVDIRRKLIDEVRSMSDFQKADENKETLAIVGNLSGQARTRLISTLTDAAGGYLLPKPFLAEVFRIVEEFGVARSKFRTVPMTSKTIDLKNLATKPTAYWVDEGARILASDITFGTGALTPKKLGGLSVWSNEIDEDEAIAHLPILIELFGEAIATKEDEAGFIGDGTATYGSFTGVLNAAGKVYTMPATKTTFSDLTADDLRKAIDQLSLSSRVGAEWFLDPDIVSIIERLKNSQGDYIFRSPVDGNGVSRVWGFPVNQVDVMPSVTGVSTKFIVFGNPKNMLFGQRRGLEAELSKEAIIQDNAAAILHNLYQEDKTAIRLTERVGFVCALANRFVAVRTAAA